ncbi:MAG: nucleotidyltransferase domain-containing protein [Candidatus Peribacteraceae bacterium]|nr:nucleotidyltransferase domain-containing protein [Candidatus Peribacteraceae bacterium]
MKTIVGLRAARALRKRLEKKGIVLRNVYLFGSVARGNATAESDIDIAVVCDPYKATKHQENVEFLLEGKKVDMRIQTVCLRPEDFQNPYFTLAKEVEKYGIAA